MTTKTAEERTREIFDRNVHAGLFDPNDMRDDITAALLSARAEGVAEGRAAGLKEAERIARSAYGDEHTRDSRAAGKFIADAIASLQSEGKR
jgi:hypothetical protein